MTRRLILALAVAGTAGCLRDVRDEEGDRPPVPRPPLDLAAEDIRRVAVVEAADRTGQGAGLPAARALHEALRAGSIRLHPTILTRPGGGDLARSWLEAQRRDLGVDAFATGTVSAFAVQAHRGRAYVAMTAVLIDGGGRIRWSRRVSGSAPLAGLSATLPDEGYNGSSPSGPSIDQAAVHRDALAIAVHIAAQEFAHDLVPGSP